MKRFIVLMLIVLFSTLLLPLAIIYLMGLGGNADVPIESGSVSVFLSDEGRTEEMDINEYLKCVVAAEMPADFEAEALKAQAVAARTYLYSHIEQAQKGNIAEGHNGAAVCTDSSHCQAYISADKRRKSWGDAADANWEKVSGAVESTTGEIMTYNGETISAVFHSTSSGSTEAAVDVWGSDVPYLQSVASVGDEQSPKYKSEVSMSEAEFKNIAEDKVDGVDWSKGVVTDIARSGAGGIISLKLGGIEVKGTDFRTIFDLRSTNVEIINENGSVKMSVKGYGHGVGMSQYGANYLASQGKKYEEILKTYYTDVEIVQKNM